MSSGVQDGPNRRDSQPDRPEVHLSRYDSDRWTLSDGRGVIVAAAEDLVPVEQ